METDWRGLTGKQVSMFNLRDWKCEITMTRNRKHHLAIQSGIRKDNVRYVEPERLTDYPDRNIQPVLAP